MSTFATIHDVRIAVNGGFDAERDQGVPQFSGQRTDKGFAAGKREGGVALIAGGGRHGPPGDFTKLDAT